MGPANAGPIVFQPSNLSRDDGGVSCGAATNGYRDDDRDNDQGDNARDDPGRVVPRGRRGRRRSTGGRGCLAWGIVGSGLGLVGRRIRRRLRAIECDDERQMGHRWLLPIRSR